MLLTGRYLEVQGKCAWRVEPIDARRMGARFGWQRANSFRNAMGMRAEQAGFGQRMKRLADSGGRYRRRGQQPVRMLLLPARLEPASAVLREM